MNGDHNPAGRELLQGSFQNGDRPNSDDFARVFASFLNLTDEDIHIDGTSGDTNIGIGQENPEQRLDVNGALRIGFSDEDVSGSIRWNQTDGRFEFNDGGGWQPLNLGGGGGGTSPWTGSPDISYKTGNVGIGTVPVTPLHVDGGTDVELTNNSGYVILGNPTANHLAIDEQEIMARVGNDVDNTVVPATLRLQNDGGSVRIGQSAVTHPVDLRVFGDALKSGTLTWGPASDKRLKKNIKPFKDGLGAILKINPVKFKYNGKAGMPTEKEYIGLIAQDLGKVCPDLIMPFLAKSKEKDNKETEFFSYNADGIIFLMLNAIKELAGRMDTLEKELAGLKNKQ